MAVPKPCNINEEILARFACGTPSTPIEGAIYAPYVEMGFGSLQKETKIILTVGNDSAPTGNLAAITSFECGGEVGNSGFGISMEIIDHGGAMYKDIIRNLNKTVKNRKAEMNMMEIDFGWIITNPIENGGSGIPKPHTLKSTMGKYVRGLFTGLDTSFDGGNVKIKLKLGPPIVSGDLAQTGTIGSTDQPVDLKEAIRQLLTSDDVGFSDVQFRSGGTIDDMGNVIDDGAELEFKNSDQGKNGPKSSWPMDQMNALAITRQWLTTVTSAAGRGLLVLYDSESNSVIIKEDPYDKENSACCQGNIATYIVNGGNCSPVLEFNPSIEWLPGMIPGKGGINGGASGGKAPILEPQDNIQKTGTQSSPFIDQHVINFRSPDDQAEDANEAFAANTETEERSGPGSGGKGGWEATLKIQGDPFYGDTIGLVGSSVSILFINPYYFGDPEGPTWLQTTNCNTMLSNKRYLVKAVNHNISNGSYTTTLKLKLSVPNVDIDFDSTLGGNGCGSLDQKFVDATGASTL
jgi:hypothetical protein